MVYVAVDNRNLICFVKASKLYFTARYVQAFNAAYTEQCHAGFGHTHVLIDLILKVTFKRIKLFSLPTLTNFYELFLLLCSEEIFEVVPF